MSSPLVLVVMMMVSMGVIFQVAQGIHLKLPPPPRQPVTHLVGGGLGWGWCSSSSLADWVKGKTFRAGDKLRFEYTLGRHNVYQVDKTGYDNCKTSSNSRLWTTGNDVIQINQKGWHYFICNYPGTCVINGDSGMKLKVDVI